jgi:hypothetical protein
MSSTSTWEEIKRLAADFQRVQLVESSYKYDLDQFEFYSF